MNFNARGFVCSLHEIQSVMKVHLALISETHLTTKSKLYFPGYTAYWSDCQSKGGGVMMVIDEKIDHDVIPLPAVLPIEAVGLKFRQGSKSTTVICYCKALLDTLLNYCHYLGK